ncbi:MAG: FAD/NAD(P)-binding oxidoreductase, partial [Burkholderiales bacterium]
MTASRLLLWICLGIAFQLALAILVGLWRKRRGAAVSARDAPGEGKPVSKSDAWRAFRVTKREFEDPAQTQCSFYLEPTDAKPLPDYAPGQYLTFPVPIADPAAPDGVRTLTRCYSLSEASHPTRYRVTIKRASPPAEQPTATPGLSSNHFHDHVHVGNVLKIKPPSGHFYLDTKAETPVVLIAGGIGITPMMSMLQWLVQHQPAREVHLFYGVRNGYEHAFKAELQALAATHPQFHLQVVYSRQEPEDRLSEDFDFAGRIDTTLLTRVLGGHDYQFYLCGPSALMNTLVPALL